MLPRYSSASEPTVSSANRPHLRRAIGIVGERVGLDDLHDDRRDVVQPSAAVRFRDERLHLALRLRGGAEQLREPAVVHHARQAVARHEEDVARARFAAIDVRLHVAPGADAARDHVAVRVVARLFGGEVSRVHLLLHVRVILRQLLELSTAQQVDARVAHLADEVARAGQNEHRRRRPHALLVHFRERALVDRAVGVLERVRHELHHVLAVEVADVGELALDDLYRHFARHFPCRVSSHPVRYDEDPSRGRRIDREVVLVPRADHAHVGAGGMDELHARPRSTKMTTAAITRASRTQRIRDVPAAGEASVATCAAAGTARFRSSAAREARAAASSGFMPAGMNRNFTPPNRTSGAPSSRRSPVTRDPPTYVPFVEFMSTTYQPSSRRSSLAWISLTLSSVRRTSLFAPRPTWARGVRIA